MLKKIRKYCDQFKNCEGCELKTANPQGMRVCIFNVPPCGWLDSEIEKVNEVLKGETDGQEKI